MKSASFTRKFPSDSFLPAGRPAATLYMLSGTDPSAFYIDCGNRMLSTPDDGVFSFQHTSFPALFTQKCHPPPVQSTPMHRSRWGQHDPRRRRRRRRTTIHQRPAEYAMAVGRAGKLTDDGEVDAGVASGWHFKVDPTAINAVIGAPDVGQREPRRRIAGGQLKVRPSAEDLGVGPVTSFIERMLPGVETAAHKKKINRQLYRSERWRGAGGIVSRSRGYDEHYSGRNAVINYSRALPCAPLWGKLTWKSWPTCKSECLIHRGTTGRGGSDRPLMGVGHRKEDPRWLPPPTRRSPLALLIII